MVQSKIELQPNGDILIDGMKCGECGLDEYYTIRLQGYHDQNIISIHPIERIKEMLTNGFKPQKWEE